MSVPSEETVINASKWGTETFVANYYKFWDQNRAEALKLYKEWTTVVWNGKKYGMQQYMQLLQSLPSTSHDVESVDVQPIVLQVALNSPTLLVTVTGTVSYNNDTSSKRLFTQNFIVYPEQGGYFVASDNFRWIAPSSKRTAKQEGFQRQRRQ